MRIRKILLLNPPGTQIYHRDYYCSCVSKAKYYYYPLDLLFLSGTLSNDYEVKVIDAIAEKLSVEITKERISEYQPDDILFLISSPSYEEDTQFLTDLARAFPKTRFIGTGDIYREYREKSFKMHPFLKAVLTDFSTNDILTYLSGKQQGKIINNIIYRDGQKIYSGPERHRSGYFHIPVPRWDLFSISNYAFPFSRYGKFARIMTDFGCPFACSFCPGGSLGYKLRDLDTVIDEMKMVSKMGIKELYVADFTFGFNKERTFDLLKRMQKEKFNFSWTAFSRIDVVTEKLLIEMVKTGCHTLMVGIESANETILKNYHKNIKRKQMMTAIEWAKKRGLKVLGTFIIGLPGESRKSILATIKFSTKIGLDYASFNIATPRFGTPFYKEMLRRGEIDKNDLTFDSAKAKPRWKHGKLSNSEILELQKLAVKSFYLRPGYLLHRLFGIRTFYEFRRQIEEGWSLITGR